MDLNMARTAEGLFKVMSQRGREIVEVAIILHCSN